MLTIHTRVHVSGLKGREVTDFLSTCDDEAYQRWWPGTHLRLHTVKGAAGSIGSLVYMDEFIGRRRVRETFMVTALVPGKRLGWQLVKVLRLPVWLDIRLADDGAGVWIDHSIHAGYKSWARIFDPLFRLWFPSGFAAAMDEHVRTEFPRLRDLLHGAAGRSLDGGNEECSAKDWRAPGPEGNLGT